MKNKSRIKRLKTNVEAGHIALPRDFKYEEIKQTWAAGIRALLEFQKSFDVAIFAAQNLSTELEVFEEMFEQENNRPPSYKAESPSVIIDDYTGAVGVENQEGGE